MKASLEVSTPRGWNLALPALRQPWRIYFGLVEDRFHTPCAQILSYDQRTDHVAKKYWDADIMKDIYETMALPWSDAIKQHSAVHVLTHAPNNMVVNVDGEEMVDIYIHTSMSNMARCLAAGQLGRRYIFKSARQAALHRAIHHHFELSNASLSSGEVLVIQGQVKEVFLSDVAIRCTNGYSVSERVETFDVINSGFKVTGVIKILDSLREYLASDAGIQLT
eukprot:868376-Amphidinium_carterae.1